MQWNVYLGLLHKQTYLKAIQNLMHIIFLNQFHNVGSSSVCLHNLQYDTHNQWSFAADGGLAPLCSYRFYTKIKFTIKSSLQLALSDICFGPKTSRDTYCEAECWLLLTSILSVTRDPPNICLEQTYVVIKTFISVLLPSQKRTTPRHGAHKSKQEMHRKNESLQNVLQRGKKDRGWGGRASGGGRGKVSTVRKHQAGAEAFCAVGLPWDFIPV